MADIVLINPKFDVSFFGYELGLHLVGKHAHMPNAALPLLAALTPGEHQIALIDENVEPIDFDRCARADIVGLTGMHVQRRRMREILTELKRRNVFTVVGGPWVTLLEDYFGALADVIFVGEAEDAWPQFLAEWQHGRAAKRYQQADKTDMARVPLPRLDLLKMDRYAAGTVQFSRGCPFLCEFCDIIVVFGRRPRYKTAKQIVAELVLLRDQKKFFVFIVDDNLVANKKAIKDILVEVIAWQRANAYPLSFHAEASIDVADDDDLIRLMAEASIRQVFVGIESPKEASLREARKLQNLRRGGSMLEKVRRMQDAGIEVAAGMVLGFDNDDELIFDAHRKFIDAARINLALVGMLFAIPSTPLHARLARENRLDYADQPAYGTNVIPLQMTREALSRGFVELMTCLYEPNAFFRRLDDLYITARLAPDRPWRQYTAGRPWLRHSRYLLLWTISIATLMRIVWRVPDNSLRRLYIRRCWGILKARRNAIITLTYVLRCGVHYHLYQLSRTMAAGDRPPINTY